MNRLFKSIIAMVTSLVILCGGGCNLHHIISEAIAEIKGVEAMAQNETWINHDLLDAVKVQYLDGNLFSMDNAGNLIGVKLTRNGVDYSGGGSVSANVIRADGATVSVVGALSGNAATVVLPQAAYAVPGVVSIVVKLTVSGEVTTIAAVVANVYKSNTDSVVDPGTIIPSVQTLIAAIDAAVASIPADYSSLWTSIAPAFSTSTNYTAGQYVTYNGAVYRFTVDHPAGAWNSAHVVATNIGSDLNSLKNAIGTVPSGKTVQGQIDVLESDTDSLKSALHQIGFYTIGENITDGETLHPTGIILHHGIKYFITVSPTTSNYFNVIVTHNGTDTTYLGTQLITGGNSYTWEYVLPAASTDDGTWSITVKNTSNSANYSYTIYGDTYILGINKNKDDIAAINDHISDEENHVGYLQKNINITDGETYHDTGFAYDLSMPVKITVSPTTTNAFNVLLKHGSTEQQYFGQKTITGGESETWEISKSYLTEIMENSFAFDDQWRIFIKNTTNSGNYTYSIEYDTRDIVDPENAGIIHVSTRDLHGVFSKVSHATRYAMAKYNRLTPVTVYVANGIYTENPTNEFPYAPVNIADSRISVIGESRDNTIITLTNSQAVQSRIMHIGGDQTVANFTMKVLAGETWESNNGNNPYVIHNDDTFNDFTDHYITTVENCLLYSECVNPIGAGLHGKQTQIYRNVETVFNPNAVSSQGSAYIHGASNEGQIPDGVVIDGCTFISKNASPALTMPDVSGYTPYTETPVTIRRTILCSNGGTEVVSNFKSTHLLTADSKLNSNDAINY